MLRFVQKFLRSVLYSIFMLSTTLQGENPCADTTALMAKQGNAHPMPNCTEMFVDISAACLVPCNSTDYYVRYCNFGDEVAANAYVVINFDSSFTINGASLPIASQNGNTLSFNLGDVAPDGCGSFSIQVTVACDAVLHQSHCVDAQVFPNSTCDEAPPVWDGSLIEATIECQGDSIYFILENNGTGDMSQPSQCIIIEDDLVVMVSGFYLPSGEDTTLVLPNNGGFYHFEAGQTPANPSGFFTSASTEGCNGISIGFLPQYPADDLVLSYESTCLTNDTACHFNKKIAAPIGFGPNHSIASGIPLQYQVNFQNTSTDTVATVAIYDTLSTFLDTNTLLLGASSYDFQFENLGNNIIKFTFENVNLPPGGSGFVKFQIGQIDDVPFCSRIENWAGIDYGSFSITTDTVFHTINCLDTMVVDTIFNICNGGGYYLGTYYTQNSFVTSTASFSTGTSVLNTSILVYPGTPDETVYATICEGETYEFEGQSFTDTGTYTFDELDENGCPYTITLFLTVEENEEEIIFGQTCEGVPYEFHGQSLTSAGIYSHVEPSGNCFKIEILVLSVNPVYAQTSTVSICQGDTLIWENEAFVSDTVVTHEHSSQFGCDSITTLELQVYPNYELALDAAICEGESYQLGANSYSTSGSFTDTLSTMHGCDSIVTVNLTVLPHQTTSLAANICEGESYVVGDESFTQTGTYEIVLTSENGCDSLVTLVLVVQAKNPTCTASAGPDTLVCGYDWLLVGTPSPGTWEVLCNISDGLVDFDNQADGSAQVTVDQCGSYFFQYTHSHLDTMVIFDSISMVFDTIVDTCSSSDIVQIDFEDPSYRVQTIQVELDLGYNDYSCGDDEGITCSNVFLFNEAAPVPAWSFDLSMACQSNIYSTTVDSVLEDCVANDITVNQASTSSVINPAPFGTGQGAFIDLDISGNVTSNDFLGFIDSLFLVGLNMINGECPPAPPGCFPSNTPEIIGYDTLYLEVPVHQGGQWTYLDSLGQNLSLEDSTDLVLGNETYRLVITPNSTTYSPVQFELWLVENDSTLLPPSQPVSISFQWQEKWELDTVLRIMQVLAPVECPRGNFIEWILGDVPPPPMFDCPPFTITFEGNTLAMEEELVCGTDSYTVQLTIEGGTPPYQLEGLSGNFVGANVFLSEPLPFNMGYAAHLTDAAGCEGDISGEPCRCNALVAESSGMVEANCLDSCIMLVGNVVGGNNGWEVQWVGPQGIISNSETANACGEGLYVFKVMDVESGCADSSITEVYLDLPVAEAGPDLTLTCAQNTVALQGAELTSNTPISFHWEGPGITTSNQGQSSPIVDEPGVYLLTVTNQLTGCADLDSVAVALDANTPLAVIDPVVAMNCHQPTQLLNGDGSVPSGQLSFYWYTNNGNIVAGGDGPNPTIDEAGLYYLIVTNVSTGCTDEAQVMVQADFAPPQQVSAGANLQLDCSNNLQVLQGSVAGGNSLSFSWTTVNGNIVDGEATLNPTVDQPGTYQLTVTDLANGCTAQSQVEVEADFEAPNLEVAVPDTLDCLTLSLVIDASASDGGPNILYQWTTSQGQIVGGANGQTPEVNAAGAYYLALLNTDNGCQSFDTVEVAQNIDQPQVNAGMDSYFSCATDTLALAGTSASAGWNIIYAWEPISGSISSGQSTLTPVVDSPGSYVLTVENESNGCLAKDTVVVAAYEPVSFDLVIAPDCLGEDVGSISVVNLIGQSSSYFFQLDNGQVWHDSLLTALPAGNYTLSVLDLDSCSVEVDFSIEELSNLPELSLEEEYHFCGADDPIFLDASLWPGSPWVSYLWSNSDTAAMIEVAEEGTYTVDISTPCELATYEFEVIDDLKRSSFFEMPNVFTPNNDRLNDLFSPVAYSAMEEYELIIFDRWGNKVFSTNDFENRWDGTFKGEQLSSDVYIYKVFASFSDCIGNPYRFSLKGDVTLLR